MGQAQKDDTGKCVVCGSESIFRFDATKITAQLREAWGSRTVLLMHSIAKKACFVASAGAV
jgi:hypothetical protein